MEWWLIVMIAVACTGGFFGPFFGTQGEDGRGSYWLLGVLTAPFLLLFALPNKAIRDPTELKQVNIFGMSLGRIKWEWVESMEVCKGGCCGSPCVKATLTDEGLALLKKEQGCMACCVTKTDNLGFEGEVLRQFLVDHGMSDPVTIPVTVLKGAEAA